MFSAIDFVSANEMFDITATTIAFGKRPDRLDNVEDRLLGAGNLERPRAVLMISRARLASTTRPLAYDSSAVDGGCAAATRYSYRKATIGSTRLARRAGW